MNSKRILCSLCQVVLLYAVCAQTQADPIGYWNAKKLSFAPLFRAESSEEALSAYCSWWEKWTRERLASLQTTTTLDSVTFEMADTSSDVWHYSNCWLNFTYHKSPTWSYTRTVNRGASARYYEYNPGYYVTSKSPRKSCESEADPCDPASGEVYLTETDIQAVGKGLSFTRSYRTQDVNRTKGVIGVNWRHAYNMQMDAYPQSLFLDTSSSGNPVIRSSLYSTRQSACNTGFQEVNSRLFFGQVNDATATFTNDTCILSKDGQVIANLQILKEDRQPQFVEPVSEHTIMRPNGAEYRFSLVGGTWTNIDGQPQTLKQSGSNWLLTLSDGTTEIYEESGKLTQSTTAAGLTTQYAYADNQLINVTGPFGDTLNLEYTDGRISRVTGPDGSVDYSYDNFGNLTQVSYPDGTARQYLYENTRYIHALTGVINEQGIKVAMWEYDDQGRVILNERTGGVERYSFSYNSDGTTTVTDAAGATRIYRYAIANGARKFVEVTGDRCDTCGHGADQQRTYDALGQILKRTDWNGNQTTYVRDGRGLVISQTKAIDTPQENTIQTEWHPNFRKPVRVTEPNRIIDYTYDNAGHMLSKIERAAP